MAFFDKVSTHMLSLIAAVYGVFIYSIAFSLEMWFIVTAPSSSFSKTTLHHDNSHGHQNLNQESASSHPTSSLLKIHHPQGRHSPLLISSPSDHIAVHADLDDLSGEVSPPSVPILAFVLAALYFVTVMVSLLLILGIIIRSMMCILTWLITIVLMFLPEAALVLFITIYHWVRILCDVNE